MIQNLKHTNLSKKFKLSKRTIQAKEQVKFVFLKKESTEQNQSQQKKVFAATKITSVKSLLQVGNS